MHYDNILGFCQANVAEVIVHIHGIWAATDKEDKVNEEMFENAIVVSDRAGLSLDSLGYTFPVIGFS
jgi:hypothetical protein